MDTCWPKDQILLFTRETKRKSQFHCVSDQTPTDRQSVYIYQSKEREEGGSEVSKSDNTEKPSSSVQCVK